MEDEKEDPPPFRWNPQAIFMLFFFMAAMALPLGGVLWFARGYLSAQQRIATPAPEVKTVDTSSLEKGLEKMSDSQFASTVTLEDGSNLELEVAADDMDARIARIAELAKSAGGSALDMSEPGATKVRRVTVQVPQSRMELLKRAIRGDQVDFSAIPAGTATQMLEIDLKAP